MVFLRARLPKRVRYGMMRSEPDIAECVLCSSLPTAASVGPSGFPNAFAIWVWRPSVDFSAGSETRAEPHEFPRRTTRTAASFNHCFGQPPFLPYRGAQCGWGATIGTWCTVLIPTQRTSRRLATTSGRSDWTAKYRSRCGLGSGCRTWIIW